MKNQKRFVLNQLITKGQVSRNTCLANFISRLGAIMCVLKEDGLKYEGSYVKEKRGNDYVYKVKKGQKGLLNNLLKIYG